MGRLTESGYTSQLGDGWSVGARTPQKGHSRTPWPIPSPGTSFPAEEEVWETVSHPEPAPSCSLK